MTKSSRWHGVKADCCIEGRDCWDGTAVWPGPDTWFLPRAAWPCCPRYPVCPSPGRWLPPPLTAEAVEGVAPPASSPCCPPPGAVAVVSVHPTTSWLSLTCSPVTAAVAVTVPLTMSFLSLTWSPVAAAVTACLTFSFGPNGENFPRDEPYFITKHFFFKKMASPFRSAIKMLATM